MVFQAKPFSDAITGPYSVCVCTRCGNQWNAKNPDHRPGGCPQCGSANWDRAPRKSNARTPADPPNPRWGKYRRPRQLCPLCIRPLTGGLAAIEARKQRENWRQARKIGGVPMMTESAPRNRQNLGPRPARTNPDGSMIITPAERELAEYLIRKHREVDAAGVTVEEVPVRVVSELPRMMTPPPGLEAAVPEPPASLTPPPFVGVPSRPADDAGPEVQASRVTMDDVNRITLEHIKRGPAAELAAELEAELAPAPEASVVESESLKELEEGES